MLDKLFVLSWKFIENYNREYIRYFKKEHSLNNRFSIILGPRGVGKTTVIIQHLLDYVKHKKYSKKAIYIQADHFLIGNSSLYEITEDFINEGGELICFDEIHKYPEWSRDLKSIYDTFPKLKIIASGSSALEIYKGSHDLSRRAIVYKMAVMSFREFLELSIGKIKLESYTLEQLINNHNHISDLIINKIEKTTNKILPLFKKYLKFGCYPYFIEYNDMDYFFITLEQNVHTIIESDLSSIYPRLNGLGLKKIKKLISFISNAVPFTPDLKKIKKILEIGDERTLKMYLKYLEDGGLIRTVSKKGKSLSALEKPEKIFLHNTNLSYAIGSMDGIQIESIRESFFITALSLKNDISVSDQGDFLVNDNYIFEIGGKKKTFNHIKDLKNSFLAIDDIEKGFGNKIPLWLFGFLY